MRRTLNRVLAFAAVAVSGAALTVAATAGASHAAASQDVVKAAQSANYIYALSPNHDGVYRWDGSAWTHIGGPAGELYAGGAGLIATNPRSGDVYKYNNAPHNWTKIGGPGSHFAVTGYGVYGVSPDRSGVYRYNGYGTNWTRVGGPAAKILCRRLADCRQALAQVRVSNPDLGVRAHTNHDVRASQAK